MTAVALPVLARNFVLGGAIAAAYTALRAARSRGADDDPNAIVLDPQPRHIPLLCADAMPALRDISALCERVPPAPGADAAYRRDVRRAIRSFDDMLCIERQLASGDLGKPTPQDHVEALRLAHDAMHALRRAQRLLAHSDFWYAQYEQNADALVRAMTMHLDNINKHVYG